MQTHYYMQPAFRGPTTTILSAAIFFTGLSTYIKHHNILFYPSHFSTLYYCG